MTFLNRLCAALDGARLPYAIVGGHAVALHGAVRGTVDIDIALRWGLATLTKTERTLAALGLKSRLPVSAGEVFRFRDEYVRNRNLVAWNFYNPRDLSEQVDVIINFDLKGKKTRVIRTGEGPVRVLDRQDLILMKRQSGRPQDLEDARALERLG